MKTPTSMKRAAIFLLVFVSVLSTTRFTRAEVTICTIRKKLRQAEESLLPFSHTLVRTFVLSALTFIICFSAFRAQTQTLGSRNNPTTLLANSYQTAAQLNQPSTNKLWRDVDVSGLQRSADDGGPKPKKYRAVSLNTIELEGLLEKTPLETSPVDIQSASILSLPMPDGSFARFQIEESPVVEEGLANRFPFLKTYRGQGIDDPAATVRFDFMPDGFHAIILSSKSPIQIAPVSKGDREHYLSYYAPEDPQSDKPFLCGTKDDLNAARSLSQLSDTQPVSSGSIFRTYVIAIGATGEFTQAHGGGTVAGGLAAITTILNQANAMYERDLSMRFILAANNQLVVFTNPATDPYDDGDVFHLINQNLGVLQILGSGSYDVGHVFATGGTTGGGAAGVAFLGVTCTPVDKAGGVSTTLSGFQNLALGVFAHELGHQLGATHTFNTDQGQRFPESAFEPNVGFTIMARSGGGISNYHVASLEQILNHIQGLGNTCADKTPTNNSIPVVYAIDQYNVPKQTPFALSATAFDLDGGSLTYEWQEYDLGPPFVNPSQFYSQDSDADGFARPIFRGYPPTTDPTRLFPSKQFILNHANFPPPLYDCTEGPVFTCLKSNESMPNITRTMNFKVVVRDNRVNGGAFNTATSVVNVDGNSGPFRLTSPNTNIKFQALTSQTVTWDVANTNNPPINTTNVNIRLSTDGGNSFPILLTTTENDGSEPIFLPNVATSQARIMVEADGNIFFDVSDVNFAIGNCVTPAAGLVSWYRAQNNADDTLGTNNGTTNGNGFAPGKVGQGFEVTNSTGITVADNDGLNQQNFTIDSWIKIGSSTGTKIIAAKSGTSGLFGYEFGTSNGLLRLALNGGTGDDQLMDDVNVADNVFHHVAASYDGSLMKIYLDGSLAAQKSMVTPVNYETGSLFVIGSRQNTSAITVFQGTIDELSFYDRALSDAEIQGQFNAEGLGKCDATALQLLPAISSIGSSSTIQFSASAGVPPYIFDFVTNQSDGMLSANGLYTAGNLLGQDLVRVTDANNEIAVASVKVIVPCVSGQKTWDGEGTTNNWSDARNWNCDQLPAAGEAVFFNNASRKNVVFDTDISVGSITIAPTYTGMIQQAFGRSITVSGDFIQSGGTFIGITDLSFGNFELDGGSFIAPQAAITLSGNFSLNGGTFDFSGGSMAFVGGPTSVNLASDLTVKNLEINKNEGSTLAITNNRTVRVFEHLHLIEGNIGNSLATIKSEGFLTVESTFGDASGNVGGGNATLLIQDGHARQDGNPRIVFVSGGTSLPKILLNDPAVQLSLSGDGIIRTGAFTLNDGTVELQCNLLVGYDPTTAESPFVQNGGTFGVGYTGVFTMNTAAPFRLNDGVFGVTLGNLEFANCGSIEIAGGAFYSSGTTATFNSAGGSFVQSGGFFDAAGDQNFNGTATLTGGTFRAQPGNIDFNQGITLNGGTFANNGANLTAAAITIGPGGVLTNNGTSYLTLGGNLSNSGLVDFEGGGLACGDDDAILIRSSVEGTQRHWSGSGTFNMRDVDVRDQAGDASIQVFSGTNSGNNGTNWTINSGCSVGAGPPVADNQLISIDEDTTKSITLTATDPNQDPITYSIVSFPTRGRLSGNAPNLVYTPDPNFNGADSFRFKASDAQFDSNIAIVFIIVQPVNDVPVATGRTVSAFTKTSTQIQLLATDADGDTLTVSSISSPAHGTVTVNGLIATYTSADNYLGTDRFSYTVSDGTVSSASATVTINVVNGITIATVSRAETNSGINQYVFNVGLLAPTSSTVSVQYATANGTAVAGSDYTAKSGTLTFKSGQTAATISIDVAGEKLFESDETFFVRLSNPVNAVLRDNYAAGVIINDDPLIGISELNPSNTTVGVGERCNLALTWTHPERWRLLDTIDFRIIDDRGSVMWVRFSEPTNTFSLYNPNNGSYGTPVTPGTVERFDSNAATMYVEHSSVQGSGPTGPSVVLTYSLSFKPRAAGRTFRVEAFAIDDFGNQQGFDVVGTVSIQP
jgi:hypothetical protein